MRRTREVGPGRGAALLLARCRRVQHRVSLLGGEARLASSSSAPAGRLAKRTVSDKSSHLLLCLDSATWPPMHPCRMWLRSKSHGKREAVYRRPYWLAAPRLGCWVHKSSTRDLSN